MLALGRRKENEVVLSTSSLVRLKLVSRPSFFFLFYGSPPLGRFHVVPSTRRVKSPRGGSWVSCSRDEDEGLEKVSEAV
jgi:hypothetical protein